MGRAAQSLCAAGVISLCACGLDKNGLFDLEAGVSPAAPVGSTGDVEFVYVFPPEGGADADLDAEDAPAMPDDGGGMETQTSTDSASGADALARADVAADGPLDAPSLPIVYEGGTIADPQFADSDWTSFCVALAGCGQIPSISRCVALLRQPSAPDALIPPPHLVASVNNAGSDCARIGQLLGDGSGCPATTADTCAGGSLVTCRWGFRMTIDCSSLGMVCSMGRGNAGCGFGDCSPAQEGKTYCVGPSELVQCNLGRYSALLSCQTFGAKCAGPAEAASCMGTAGSGCSGAPVCSNASIVECLNGLLGSADCATLYGSGFTCLMSSAGTPVCAAGTACNPITNVDACMGNQAEFCNAGAKATYDCKGKGWPNGCDAGRCTP